MKDLGNLKIEHRCKDCSLSKDYFFCALSPGSLERFESLKITNAYPKGSALFMQGQPAEGIYMLCQGRVKLCTYSSDGKTLILGIVEPGEVLGLSAVISDAEHEVTAEVLEPCQVNFVRKRDFMRFLSECPDGGINALLQLSRNYNAAHTQICSLGLSHSVGDKLAKLMVGWCENGNGNGNGKVRRADGGMDLRLSFSHEEIAEMIGSSRETVTRLLKEFRQRGLITLKGSALRITDVNKLGAMVGHKVRDAGEM